MFSFTGHLRMGWDPDDRNTFIIPAAAYRQLAGQVDAAMADYRQPVVNPDNGEMIVCTDGPGSLTERVRGGVITSLTGTCPPSATALHPNRVIAAAMQDMLCRRLRQAARRTYWSGRRCFERLETIAEYQANAEQQ